MSADLTAMVRAAQGGDEDAFRQIYRTLQPGLLRYLTVLVGADAEDIASETWLQVSRDLPNFTGDEFRAWTVTIARNRALDHLRRERRRPTIPVPVQALRDLPANTDTAERANERISTRAAIEMIARLPKREAEAVLLRAVIGLDAESAGRVLGRRSGAIRTAAHRGLRRLAAELRQQETPEPAAAPPAASPPVPAPRSVPAPSAPRASDVEPTEGRR